VLYRNSRTDAEEAFNEIKMTEKYLPTIPAYTKAVSRIIGTHQAKTRDSGPGFPSYSGLWVCGRVDDSRPWVGYPVLWPNAASVPNDPGGAMLVAQDMLRSLQSCYGGTWEVREQWGGDEHRDPTVAWNREEQEKNGRVFSREQTRKLVAGQGSIGQPVPAVDSEAF
jgi:hypothetical protein